MIPDIDDVTMQIPVTLDYKGGRAEVSKGKWLLVLLSVGVSIVVTIAVMLNKSLPTWQKWLFAVAFDYIVLIIIRFLAFKEAYYSDVYETLKETKNNLPLATIWDVFDISWTYPYILYFRNGTKGILVRMEKDAIVGKGSASRYDHYEAISDAYNLAHSLKMDIRHIDYMDNVGNDNRLREMYDQLKAVKNQDMLDMMLALYQNLEMEMSRNYASFDVYLYLTRGKVDTFISNVQAVSNAMCGGNFITYKVLDRNDIRGVVMALFNLHDFSVSEACEETLEIEDLSEIIPIKVIHGDGTEEKLNKTQEEKRIAREERERRELEEKQNRRHRRKHKKEIVNEVEAVDEQSQESYDTWEQGSFEGDDEDLGLFDEEDDITFNKEDEENINLF